MRPIQLIHSYLVFQLLPLLTMASYGQLFFFDGSHYTGTLWMGQPHGNGMLSSIHYQYEGGHQYGLRHGHGKLTCFCRCTTCTQCGIYEYEGGMYYGSPHGFGKITYSQETGVKSYSGQFHLGNITGYGVAIYSDGSYFEGTWKDGLLESHGVSTSVTTYRPEIYRWVE